MFFNATLFLMIIFIILNLFSVIFMFWNSAFKRGNLEL